MWSHPCPRKSHLIQKHDPEAGPKCNCLVTPNVTEGQGCVLAAWSDIEVSKRLCSASSVGGGEGGGGGGGTLVTLDPGNSGGGAG